MCRLLAFVMEHEADPESLLSPSEVEEFRQLSLLHCDGWGAAWSDLGASPNIYHAVTPARDDPRFMSLMNDPDCTAGLVHLRWASPGMRVAPENTHPFTFGDYAFAHNGSIPDHEDLVTLLTPPYLAHRQGTTDSELYFLIVLQFIDAEGSIAEGIFAAVQSIRARAPDCSLNAMLLSPDTLIVVQSHDDMPSPLEELLDACGTIDRIPPGHAEHYFDLRWQSSKNGLVVAHAGLSGNGWNDLDQNSVLVVDRATLAMTITSLAPTPD